MEAAAAGLPVIFRDLPEYTSLYPSAYVKAATTAAFIEQIRALFTNAEYYEKAAAMSSRLLAEFDQHKVKEQVIDLYGRMMGT